MPNHTRFDRSEKRNQVWFSALPLGISADAYIRYLAERGYADGTIDGYLVPERKPLFTKINAPSLLDRGAKFSGSMPKRGSISIHSCRGR